VLDLEKWVTDRKSFPGTHEWGQSAQERHVLVCGGYSWGLRELPGVGGPGLGEVGRYKNPFGGKQFCRASSLRATQNWLRERGTPLKTKGVFGSHTHLVARPDSCNSWCLLVWTAIGARLVRCKTGLSARPTRNARGGCLSRCKLEPAQASR
jgi:hypothetical protein